MESKVPFELDAAGNIIVKPICGWTAVPVAGEAVILRLDYWKEEPKSGQAPQIDHLQTVLKPEKALELARELERQAQRALGALNRGLPN